MQEHTDPFTVERHELSAELGSLELDESHALEKSVWAHGVVGRIIIGHVTDRPEISGKVIDGWNTLCAWKEACRHDDHFAEKHPIAKHIDHLWFASEEEMSGFVSSMQLARRNYDVGKRAFVIIRHFQNRDSRVPPLKNLMDFCSASGTLIKEVKRVALADPAIGEAFLTGVLGLHDAAAVARLPAGERREALAGGADGLKEKAREVRERRRPAEANADRAPGYGKRNVAAAMDRLHAETVARRAAMPPPAPEGPGPGEREMAAPVDPRPKSAPAASAGASGGMSAADLNMAIRAYFKANPANEQRAAALMGIEGVAEAGWVADTPAGKRKFVVDRWQQLAGARREVTVRANGAPAFDKDKMWRTAESLQRSMSRNPQVGELCEALKQTLVYMP